MKDAKNVTITDSEWMVMRAIWTMGHATSRELIDAMNELEGWSASTTKTLLHRLIQKQAVSQHGGSRPFTYKPVVGEKESMAAAADDLFDHMCAMRLVQQLPALFSQGNSHGRILRTYRRF